MGKWCEVKCSCPNREPLPGSRWSSFSEYQQREKKPRLAKSEEQWQESVKGMYECGHRAGAFIQTWPGDILRIGYALEVAFNDQQEQFPIFRQISDWRNYDNEYLAIPPEDAALWELEIEQLRRFLSGEEFLGWHEKEAFDREFTASDLLYGAIESTLEDARKFCKASAETRNAIAFYW